MVINTRISEELLLVSKSAAKHHLLLPQLLGRVPGEHTVIQAGRDHRGDLDPPAKSDQVAQSCIQVCSNKLPSILKPLEQASQVRQLPPTVLWNLERGLF